MIFADKLIQLRKKAGWSQEELAEQMNVTRQSVSKWEGAQSVPDLEKIVRLSQLFDVSTDYLLKDEIDEMEGGVVSDNISEVRHVSMEEANAFLLAKADTAKSIAIGTFLCVISPICLLILSAMSEAPGFGILENTAAGVGIIILLLFVVPAVALFVGSSRKTEKYDYLDKEVFETEYGVSGMVKKRKDEYDTTHTRNLILGVSICILSIIPIFTGMIVNDEDDLLMTGCVAVFFFIVAIGAAIIVKTVNIWESYEKLLQEGDFTKEKKKNNLSALGDAYWFMVAAIYLAYSFYTNNWDSSWIIWIAAVAVSPVLEYIFTRTKKGEDVE